MFAPKLPLETERLRIRAYTADDFDDLLAMFGREDVSRYLMWQPMDGEHVAAMLERRKRQASMTGDGEGLGLVLEERSSGRFVGEVILRWLSEPSRQGEIGWSLHPDAQGKGYATEAAREMLRLGFEDLGLHRIIAECDPRNDASIRLMERLGMRREADFRDAMWLKDEWVGSTVYAILEDEWRGRA